MAIKSASAGNGVTNDAFVGESPNPEELDIKYDAVNGGGGGGKLNLKWSIWKNIVVISVAFMILFTSFQSMASLQSSINKAIFL
jgi:hypothetical protein